MIDVIAVGLSSLKSATELVQAFDGVKTAIAVNDVKLDLQRHLFAAYDALATAQQQMTATTTRNAELEQQIMRMEDWKAEAENYELADAGNGCLAYRKKDGVKPAEPEHWLCPRCYGEAKKSILQPETKQYRTETLNCPACGTQLVTAGHFVDQPQTRRR